MSDSLKDKFRMFQWLIFAALFYALAFYVFNGQPQPQTLCIKLGNLTVSAFVGYWIDRRAFPDARITPTSDPLLQVRRAIIIAASMLTVGLGL